MSLNYAVIIVTYKRLSLLERCLNSLFGQVGKNGKIYIGVNGDDTQTKSYLELLKNGPNSSQLNIFFYEKKYPSEVRNKLIKEAKDADYFYFIDDDAYVDKNYVEKAQNIIQHIQPLAFGGPDLGPIDQDDFQFCMSRTLDNPLIMGPTFRRHYKSKKKKCIRASEYLLSSCNLWVHRRIFFEWGIFYPENFLRNEENVLLREIAKKTSEIYWYSDLFCFHERKRDIEAVRKTYQTSGKHRGQMIPYFWRFLVVSGIFLILPFYLFLMAILVFIININKRYSIHLIQIQTILWASYCQGLLGSLSFNNDNRE